MDLSRIIMSDRDNQKNLDIFKLIVTEVYKQIDKTVPKPEVSFYNIWPTFSLIKKNDTINIDLIIFASGKKPNEFEFYVLVSNRKVLSQVPIGKYNVENMIIAKFVSIVLDIFNNINALSIDISSFWLSEYKSDRECTILTNEVRKMNKTMLKKIVEMPSYATVIDICKKLDF